MLGKSFKGQSTYSADKVDSAVYKVMSDIFSCVTNAPDENDLKRRFDKEISGSIAKQTKLRMEIQKYENQIERLNSEIASSLTGESVYTPEQLSAAIKSVNEKTTSAKAELETIIDSIENKKASMEKVKPSYEQFISWADEFKRTPLEVKKMIISQLVKRIEISKGYKINIELNMDYLRFCDGWEEIKKITDIQENA